MMIHQGRQLDKIWHFRVYTAGNKPRLSRMTELRAAFLLQEAVTMAWRGRHVPLPSRRSDPNLHIDEAYGGLPLAGRDHSPSDKCRC